ncbi:MAG: glycosyltransferase family 4 protein [Phycisphaeraceae bacterium]
METNPRILFVTFSPPVPTTHGGCQRTNLLLRALQSYGDVEMMLLRGPARLDPEVRRTMEEDFGLVAGFELSTAGMQRPWRWFRPLRAPLVDKMAHNLGRRQADYRPDAAPLEWIRQRTATRPYDVIVGRYLRPTVKSGALNFSPVVVDVDDLDYRVYETRANLPDQTWLSRIIMNRQAHQLRQLIPSLLRAATHVWYTNEADQKRMPHPSASILPNIPFVKRGEPTVSICPFTKDNQTILFVGTLSFAPNARGIDRFVERVWPQIFAARPETRFRVVGGGMSQNQRRRWAQVPGVEPVGFVDDLREAYASCLFTVAPLFEGGGTKIKVLESYRFGRACLATRHSHVGFAQALPANEAVMVAESDADLAGRAIQMLGDPLRCQAMAERGAANVARWFSYSEFERIVHDTLDHLLKRQHK